MDSHSGQRKRDEHVQKNNRGALTKSGMAAQVVSKRTWRVKGSADIVDIQLLRRRGGRQEEAPDPVQKGIDTKKRRANRGVLKLRRSCVAFA